MKKLRILGTLICLSLLCLGAGVACQCCTEWFQDCQTDCKQVMDRVRVELGQPHR